jgi:hypothetical protein
VEALDWCNFEGEVVSNLHSGSCVVCRIVEGKELRVCKPTLSCTLHGGVVLGKWIDLCEFQFPHLYKVNKTYSQACVYAKLPGKLDVL